MPEPFDPYYTWLGIPKSEQPADYYRLLGIQRFEDNREVISNAADQRMAHVRSFQTGPSARDSQRVLNELSKATGCLLNPRRKTMYDQHLQSQGVTSRMEAAQKPPQNEATTGVTIQVSTQRPAAKPPLPTAGSFRSRRQQIALASVSTIIVIGAIVVWSLRNGGTEAKPAGNQVTAAVATPTESATKLQPNATPSQSSDPVTAAPSPTQQSAVPGSPVQPAVTSPATTASKEPTTVASSVPVAVTPASPSANPTETEPPQAEIPVGRPKALHFRGSDRVELANSIGLIDFVQPFTIETWVRFSAGSSTQWIAGDLIIGPNHADVPGGTVVGWQLFLQPPQNDLNRLAFSTREGYVGEFPAAANAWHHFSVCSNGSQLAIFVDGRRAANGALARLKDAFKRSPIPIQLGTHGFMHANQPPGFTGEMRAFRISSACRYTANFEPSLDWAKDADTLVLLDFLTSTGNRIADLSGHDRHGTVSGARWVEVKTPPATAVAATSTAPTPPLASPLPPASASATSTPLPATVAPVPVPAEVAVIQAREQMRKVLKDEFEHRNDAKEQMALVDRLLKLAAESQDDLAGRYAMLDEAHKLAFQAGDLSRSLSIVDDLAKLFVVDAAKLKVTAVTKCADGAKTTADRRRVAEVALGLLDDLIMAGRFDVAGEIAQSAVAASTRAKDADLGKTAREYRDEIAQAKKRWTEAREAESQLADDKDNGDLNLRWGRFLCFYQRNWSQGLPHLARGSLPSLAAAAKLDAADPTLPEEQTAVGEAWANLMKSVETAERPAVALRALHWLRQAESQLKGLPKANVEKQVKELESALPNRYRIATTKPNQPATNAAVQPPREFLGALGRIQVNGVDAGVMWKYEAGLRLTNQSVVDIISQAGLPRGKLRMEFAGFFHTHESMTVNINHLGGSATGSATLFVDNKPLGEVGGLRATSDVYKIELPAGEHAVRWVISGDDLGVNTLNFTNASTAQPIPLYHNPVLLNLVRETPTRARLNVNMTRS